MNDTPPNAISVTHEHLAAVINTEIDRFGEGTVIRILDVGCGVGNLILYLSQMLAFLQPTKAFEIYGYDIDDYCNDRSNFFSDIRRKLANGVSKEVNLDDRIKLVSSTDEVPFPDEFFHIIVSNQVLEHVYDHAFLISEMYRLLVPRGFSVNLFPLKHYIFEGHIFLPFVHRIKNYDILVKYISLLSRIGLGNYREKKQKDSSLTIIDHANSQAKYMTLYTNYISYEKALNYGIRCRFAPSFLYTRDYYSRKLKKILKMSESFVLKKNRPGLIEWISVFFLKYVSSVTLFLDKPDTR